MKVKDKCPHHKDKEDKPKLSSTHPLNDVSRKAIKKVKDLPSDGDDEGTNNSN